jgi:predicted HTH transcriptional regulator
MWSDRPLSTITLVDLQSLITDKVRENRQLDYKDEQPAHPRANDDKKSDFAVDVSALANGSGGLLVYGVAEERDGGRPTGIASALNGLAGFNFDADGN